MAFKKMTDYNQERYGGLFRLVNDGDSARVVFLYRSVDDVLIADTHYVKSANYSGYVHCCGRGCPACGKGIRVQTKLFIPLYNLDTNEIQFFDRNVNFEAQLSKDVFENYPNPSQYVFTITRHGEPRSLDTKYELRATNKYSAESYDQILAKFNIKMPEYYENICKEVTPEELSEMLSQGSQSSAPTGDSLPDYSVTPRTSVRNTTTTAPSTPVYTPVPEDDLVSVSEELPEFGEGLDELDSDVDF
ncbi:MAG: hypothetical protein IJE78_06285 [Bacteroidaceae bacterium]|nr:hypothetical protein [Bacteroidaceae bacterium]